MRPKALPIALSALLTAASLAAGVGTAAAADQEKPASRESAKLPAVDADVSAAAARIEEQGSALGSYWDPERDELAVVVGPDSTIGEDEAEKLVGGRFRLERLEIAKKTVGRDPRADRRSRVQPPRPRSSATRATSTCRPGASSCRPTPPPR